MGHPRCRAWRRCSCVGFCAAPVWCSSLVRVFASRHFSPPCLFFLFSFRYCRLLSSFRLFFGRWIFYLLREKKGKKRKRSAARSLTLFFHLHFSLFSRESFVRCAR